MAKAKKKKENSYAAKAKKASIISNIENGLPTKGHIKNSLLETGKDILICVVGGGLVGAAIGKPSLLIGLGVTGVGHYMDNRLATLFGVGLMAANGFQSSKSVNGLDGMDLESIKGRMQAYKDNFAEKLYIDKFLHAKQSGTAKAATNGFGELQFFNYPNDMNGQEDELNSELSALTSIEDQIADSGMAHMQMSGMSMGEVGALGDMGDIGELSLVDVSDYNI